MRRLLERKSSTIELINLGESVIVERATRQKKLNEPCGLPKTDPLWQSRSHKRIFPKFTCVASSHHYIVAGIHFMMRPRHGAIIAPRKVFQH